MSDNNSYDYNLRVNTTSYQKDLQKAVVVTQKSVARMNQAYTKAQSPLAQLEARRTQTTNSAISGYTRLGRAMSQMSAQTRGLKFGADYLSNSVVRSSQAIMNLGGVSSQATSRLSTMNSILQGTRGNLTGVTSSMASTAAAAKRLNIANKAVGNSLKKQNPLLSGIAKKWRKVQNKQIAARDAAKSYEKTMHIFMKSVSRIVTGILISQAFYRMTSAIQTTITAGWEFIGVMQKAEISFTTLMGNGVEASREFMEVLELMASKTPFQLDPLRKFSQKLIAMGVDAQSMVPILDGVSNAVAAIGGDNENIIQIGNIFGRIVGKGEVSGRDLNSLARSGIPIYQIFREELELTNDELQNVAAQNISATTAINAMMRGFKKFDGLADKLAKKTVPGLTSTIKDNVLFTTKNVLQKKHERYQAFLVNLLARMQELRVVSEQFGAKGVLLNLFGEKTSVKILAFAGTLVTVGKLIGNVAQIVGGILSPVMGGFIAVMSLTASILNFVTEKINQVTKALFKFTIIRDVATSFLVLAGALIAINVLFSTASKIMLAYAAVMKVLIPIINGVTGAILLLESITLPWLVVITVAVLAVLKLTGALGWLSNKVRETTMSMAGLDKVSGTVSNSTAQMNGLLSKYSDELKIGTAFTEEMDDAMGDLAGSTAKAAGGLASFDEAYTLNEGGGLSGILDGTASILDGLTNDISMVPVFDIAAIETFKNDLENSIDTIVLDQPFEFHWGDVEFFGTPFSEIGELISEKFGRISRDFKEAWELLDLGSREFFGVKFSTIGGWIKTAWEFANFGNMSIFGVKFSTMWGKIETAWNYFTSPDFSFSKMWEDIKIAWDNGVEYYKNFTLNDFWGNVSEKWNNFVWGNNDFSFSLLWETIKTSWRTIDWGQGDGFKLSFGILWTAIKKAWNDSADPEGIDSGIAFSGLWKYIKIAWGIATGSNRSPIQFDIFSAFNTLWKYIKSAFGIATEENKPAIQFDIFSAFKTLWKYINDAFNIADYENKPLRRFDILDAFRVMWKFIKIAFGAANDEDKELRRFDISEAFKSLWKYIKIAWNFLADPAGLGSENDFWSLWAIINSAWTDTVDDFSWGLEKNIFGSFKSLWKLIKKAWTSVADGGDKPQMDNSFMVSNPPAYATGGIISGKKAQTGMFTRESYYQGTEVGENNQDEMIMPMTLDRGDPFIRAIISGVIDGLEARQAGGNVTFIAADKTSLKRLERRLNLIRLSETNRKGE